MYEQRMKEAEEKLGSSLGKRAEKTQNKVGAQMMHIACVLTLQVC